MTSSPSTKSFVEPWDLGDIVLSVEGHFVYANKTVLSMWSPVMKAMFNNDFVERSASIIELPEKTFEDILELVRVLHPPNKPVDGKLEKEKWHKCYYSPYFLVCAPFKRNA